MAVMLALSVGVALAAEKTCCEKAADAGKECRNKCCVAAHKNAKSCEKCNPQKQDLKFLKKAEKKTGQAGKAPGQATAQKQ